MQPFAMVRSLLAASFAAVAARAIVVTPDNFVPPLPDVVSPLDPSAVQVNGWLGQRIDASVTNRLLAVDLQPLLAGFQHRPGEHPWIGEHIGKWLHAATLAWAYTGDPRLKAKLDQAVRDLLATQEADGYLGTYAPAKRFGLFPDADWDVWVHKYDLIGLLTYHHFTGDPAALAAARRIGDLLIATFPARRSILAAGTHVGMAATSVLEPMVLLHRATGDARYLDFARYLVRAYDEPGGPGLVRALREHRGLDRTANGKAYEMLSNLVGLCELARETGDRDLLAAVENGWADVVANRLYVTGTASTHEHFGADHELPNDTEADVGETCVTTTWMQLNLQLLRLTGRVEHADEIERTLYNHLTAAQNPHGDDWCYFTALQGMKFYDRGITCCHSSGPRGIALAPTVAYLQAGDTIFINTLETSRAQFTVDGKSVEVALAGGFPREGHAMLTVHAAQPVRLVLKLRVPAWAAPGRCGTEALAAGWATLADRTWSGDANLGVDFVLQGRVLPGTASNSTREALAWGPFILAADQAHNSGLKSLEGLRVRADARVALEANRDSLVLRVPAQGPWDDAPRDVRLVPFADAGAAGDQYRVWLRAY